MLESEAGASAAAQNGQELVECVGKVLDDSGSLAEEEWKRAAQLLRRLTELGKPSEVGLALKALLSSIPPRDDRLFVLLCPLLIIPIRQLINTRKCHLQDCLSLLLRHLDTVIGQSAQEETEDDETETAVATRLTSLFGVILSLTEEVSRLPVSGANKRAVWQALLELLRSVELRVPETTAAELGECAVERLVSQLTRLERDCVWWSAATATTQALEEAVGLLAHLKLVDGVELGSEPAVKSHSAFLFHLRPAIAALLSGRSGELRRGLDLLDHFVPLLAAQAVELEWSEDSRVLAQRLLVAVLRSEKQGERERSIACLRGLLAQLGWRAELGAVRELQRELGEGKWLGVEAAEAQAAGRGVLVDLLKAEIGKGAQWSLDAVVKAAWEGLEDGGGADLVSQTAHVLACLSLAYLVLVRHPDSASNVLRPRLRTLDDELGNQITLLQRFHRDDGDETSNMALSALFLQHSRLSLALSALSPLS